MVVYVLMAIAISRVSVLEQIISMQPAVHGQIIVILILAPTGVSVLMMWIPTTVIVLAQTIMMEIVRPGLTIVSVIPV
jgi:hypothetical protein